MKSVLKTLVWLVAGLWLTAQPLSAQDADINGDSLEIGLLTCAPGTAVYELYGHTALRVRDLSSKGRGRDVVFNYGVFDFNTPNFTWRFMLGQTDYVLGALPFSHFAASYEKDGRSIEEQVLNLTQKEKEALFASLLRTISIPGWNYRYSFLYDNCTTRAIDEVENSVDGHIVWPASLPDKTFRRIIHEFAAGPSPWNRFGQDLILGAETDAPIGREQQMFSPVYAAAYLDGAVIVDADGQQRPLVLQKRTVVKAVPKPVTHFPLSPLAASCLLLALGAGVSAWEWRRRRVCHLFDDALMLLQGGAGCIVALLFFFSEHPAVGSNWLILLLNPLPLLWLPVKVRHNLRRQPDVYHRAMLVALGIFVVAIFVSPQSFPAEIYVLALLLLVRSVSVLSLTAKHRLI